MTVKKYLGATGGGSALLRQHAAAALKGGGGLRAAGDGEVGCLLPKLSHRSKEVQIV